MSDTKQLDEQLAEFTDRLLSGEPVVAPTELQAEAQLLRHLKTVIAPEESINPAFQQRLTRTLEKELRVTHHRRFWWQDLRLDRMKPRQLATVATIVVLAFLLVLISMPGGELNVGETVGTASGYAPAPFVIIVVINTVLVTIAGIAFWLWRNKK